MHRNQYDTDVTVWSPEGRLYQVEYAMQAVTNGGACLGLRSNTTVVLAGLKRAADVGAKFSSHCEKIFKIDSHVGMGIAGLNADARPLLKYMRTECLNHKYVFGGNLQIGRMADDVADKHQRCTQSYVRRPYGIGLLIAGVDKKGPRLFETSPNGTAQEWKAICIGSRAQSAKTYLEKNFESFPELSDDDLVVHALKALAGCVQGDVELTKENVTLSVVSAERDFDTLDEDRIAIYLDMVEVAGGADTAMDTDDN